MKKLSLIISTAIAFISATANAQSDHHEFPDKTFESHMPENAGDRGPAMADRDSIGHVRESNEDKSKRLSDEAEAARRRGAFYPQIVKTKQSEAAFLADAYPDPTPTPSKQERDNGDRGHDGGLR